MRPFDLDLMNYRKLRIAWSVGWGVVCGLLVVQWIQEMYESKSLFSYPYAFLILVAIGLAAVSWAKSEWRFSLRDFLLSTTLLAIILGTVMYIVRFRPG
jgi:hypothetical protein